MNAMTVRAGNNRRQEAQIQTCIGVIDEFSDSKHHESRGEVPRQGTPNKQ